MCKPSTDTLSVESCCSHGSGSLPVGTPLPSYTSRKKKRSFVRRHVLPSITVIVSLVLVVVVISGGAILVYIYGLQSTSPEVRVHAKIKGVIIANLKNIFGNILIPGEMAIHPDLDVDITMSI